MRAHTVFLVRAGIGFDDVKDFTQMLGLPVIAYYTMDGEGASGGGYCGELDDKDRELMSITTQRVHEMVWPYDEIKDPQAFARKQLAVLKASIKKLEKALRPDAGENELFNAADELRAEAEHLAFTLFNYDAGRAGEVDE